MAITSASLAMQLTVKEDLTYPFVSSTSRDKDNTLNGLNLTATLTPAGTPPCSLVAAGSLVMTAGAATLDLTALTGINGAISFAGKKVQAAILHNPTTSGNDITVTTGSANGYTFGTVVLKPGDRLMIYRPDTGDDVDGTHLNIDISGTGTQSLNYEMVAG